MAVGEIRERHAAGGVTQLQLACEYGVTVESINNLLRGRTWVETANAAWRRTTSLHH